MMLGKIILGILLVPLICINFAGDTLAKDQESQQIECVRAMPKPIVKKAVFPNTKFRLKRSDYVPIGFETVRFNNGDKLIITHSGCESYIFDFEFETSRFAADVTDTRYWFARSIQLMQQTEKGIDRASNIERGIKALERYARTSKQPSIGQEIDYGGEDIRSTVRLVEVKKLGNKKFLVKINFYYGPL
jgi:hypothetical protein